MSVADFALRHLLQAGHVASQNGSAPTPEDLRRHHEYKEFQFGVAVVMLMALGSCCLVTCCNCVRLGASFFVIRSRRREGGEESQASLADGPRRVVSHEWDPANPNDPVFVVQPDSDITLAYKDARSPRAPKGVEKAGVESGNSSSGPGGAGFILSRLLPSRGLVQQLTLRPPIAVPSEDPVAAGEARAGQLQRQHDTRPGQLLSDQSAVLASTGEESAGVRSGRDVAYCSVQLDASVLQQSIGDSTALSSLQEQPQPERGNSAAAFLLENVKQSDTEDV